MLNRTFIQLLFTHNLYCSFTFSSSVVTEVHRSCSSHNQSCQASITAGLSVIQSRALLRVADKLHSCQNPLVVMGSAFTTMTSAPHDISSLLAVFASIPESVSTDLLESPSPRCQVSSTSGVVGALSATRESNSLANQPPESTAATLTLSHIFH